MTNHKRLSYAAIASAFAITKPIDAVPNSLLPLQWRMDVLAVADVLQAGNAKFNRKRFLTAAGVL